MYYTTLKRSVIEVFKFVQTRQNNTYTYLLYVQYLIYAVTMRKTRLVTFEQSSQTELAVSVFRIANTSEI
jgi:hypothetical protein